METHSRFRRPGRMLVACGVAAAGLALTSLPAGAASVPGSPTITGVKVGIRSAQVSFTAPASNGGAKINNYRLRCTSSNGGAFRSLTGTKSPIQVTGLTAGKSYTCTVAARNIVGYGTPSAPSDPFVPLAAKPGAPTITSVTAGVRSVKVAFTKPADDGGAPITNYRATCTSSNGGAKGSHEGPKSPITVSGLTAGKTYTCVVQARNKVGLGAASAPSDPVVPKAH
jgi:large repetitive protein